MMRKIVAGLFMSLDGVIDSPENSPKKWGNAEIMDRIADGVAKADAVLVGRQTYQFLAQFWQHQSSDVPMAKFLNHSPKYVVSGTLETLEWQPATLIRGNFVDEIRKLKQQPGMNIQVPGSPTLVRSLLREGLLDELNLNICPVVAGSGMRLFDGLEHPMNLKMIDSKGYSNGVVAVSYQIIRAGK
jgi:dihydrofolate reductase